MVFLLVLLFYDVQIGSGVQDDFWDRATAPGHLNCQMVLDSIVWLFADLRKLKDLGTFACLVFHSENLLFAAIGKRLRNYSSSFPIVYFLFNRNLSEKIFI